MWKKNNSQNFSKYDIIYTPTDIELYAVFNKSTLNITIDVENKRKKNYIIFKH